MNEPQLTVNESILLLKQDIKVLKEGQDKNFVSLSNSQNNFHQEVKENFRDLKDNYSARLDGLETRMGSQELWRSYILGGIAVVGVVIALAAYTYITQQSIQDSRIDNLIKQVNHIPQ
jgi:type VI protein secretion system component VasF